MKKTIFLALATVIGWLLLTTSVMAYNEWTRTWSWTNSNMIDSNYNWISDWQEDFDNDWILNKDDSDYIKSLENIKDDDNDWIANKDDSDYIKNSSTKSWSWNIKSDRNQELKNKLGKKVSTVESFLSKTEDKYKNLSLEDQKNKYELFIKKIDSAVLKVEKLNTTDEKKESYRDLLEYLKLQTLSKIESL